MKEDIRNYLWGKNLKKEFRKQLKLLIIITLGFTIAFTWRQTIFDLSLVFVAFLTDVQDDATLSILSSTLITVVSIVLIYFISYWLKDKSNGIN